MTPNPNLSKFNFPPDGRGGVGEMPQPQPTSQPAPQQNLRTTAPGTVVRKGSFAPPSIDSLASTARDAAVADLASVRRSGTPIGQFIDATSRAAGIATQPIRRGDTSGLVNAVTGVAGSLAGATLSNPGANPLPTANKGLGSYGVSTANSAVAPTAQPQAQQGPSGQRPLTMADARKATNDFDRAPVPLPAGYKPPTAPDPNVVPGFEEVRPGIYQRGRNEFSDAAGLRDKAFWGRGAPTAENDAIMARMAQRDQVSARNAVMGSNWANNVARNDPERFNNELVPWANQPVQANQLPANQLANPTAQKPVAPMERTATPRLRGGPAPAVPTMQPIQNRQYSLRDFDPLAIGEDGNFAFRP